MRTWRKVYSTILDSEQVSQLSDGAAFLLTLLIVAQDDTGYWPWTPTKVRRLITSRPNWSIGDAKIYADELVSVGIAMWAGGGIVLLNGHNLNGTPRTDSKPEITPRSEVATPCIEFVTPCDESAPLEKIRVDQNRSDLEEDSALLSQSQPIPEKPKKTKVERKTKPEGDPRIIPLLQAIAEAYGDDIPHYATQASEVKTLLKKREPEEILACWKWKSQQKNGAWIPLAFVTNDIADWKAGRLPGQKGNGTNGRNGQYQGRARTPDTSQGRDPYAGIDNTQTVAGSRPAN